MLTRRSADSTPKLVLGHATTAFTQDTYLHAIPAMRDAAADEIADLIFDRCDDTDAGTDLAGSDGAEPDELAD